MVSSRVEENRGGKWAKGRSGGEKKTFHALSNRRGAHEPSVKLGPQGRRKYGTECKDSGGKGWAIHAKDGFRE